MNSSYTTQLCFAHALSIVRAIPPDTTLQPTAADKLRFYGLYKQATEGDTNIPRPSSRQIVDYAKWKAWHRMKGMSPVEAQRLYVDSLIQLLAELIYRYPHHPHLEFIKNALSELQFDEQRHLDDTQVDEEAESFQDAYDPAEFESQEHFLSRFEADQLMEENAILSPPATSTQFSFKPPHRYSVSDANVADYPITPIASPHTGQWVQGQLEQQQPHRLPIEPDLISEADTLDREVAKVTQSLTQSSPTQSPYIPVHYDARKSSQPSFSQKPSSTRKKNRTVSASTAHTTRSASLSSSSSLNSSKQTSNRAIERLQTELTALTEQMDQLRQNIKTREERDRQFRWSPWYIFKLLLKHLLVNSAIFMIAFYVLWKRNSPLADKVIAYLRPWIRNIVRNILRNIVFWKVTA
ncbi:Acyl-CoA-binding domain-containing protein 5A [Choanephora cucurbitarum]|uniref:Acyl-CoA-binding domain-containing protein 5A n=1 Tax=Choanephora cucurbitarum TaxID=101091 RepID=A0A1C7N1M4_9FUNG|nr:Acyl-CoA-binding domain-containing protein 5A [Choanephora cucurbitarum]